MTTVAAEPYQWLFDGDLRPANTALVIIDMQIDFCGIGGYVDRMVYDLSLTRAPTEPIGRCSMPCGHDAALRMVTIQDGVFGAVADADALCAAP